MKKLNLLIVLTLLLSPLLGQTETNNTYSHKDVSPKPPMGWNSYDAYHGCIIESQFKACVDELANKMLPFGYEYAVVDFCWYHPGTEGWDPDNWITFSVRKPPYVNGQPGQLQMDKHGRLIPAFNRFPSASGGEGFKPLADYTNKKGMKFGIHIMRGVPRQAVEAKIPIKGTNYTCADIAEPWDTCNWNPHMYGIDAAKPGAQEYYNSLFELYASWGVDYVKIDDITTPYYKKGEVDLIYNAVKNCGRPMVISLSPGETPLAFANHVNSKVNMWRVSSDFWDRWGDLHHMFDLLHHWSPFIGNGTWPDADMIPIGKLCLTGFPKAHTDPTYMKFEHYSRFTYDEQKMMMTLWAIARSPLMWGGDPLSLNEEQMQLLCNKELLEVNQNSTGNRQVLYTFRGDEDQPIWFADIPGSDDKYVAFFNRGEEKADLYFDFWWEDLKGTYTIRDLWKHEETGTTNDKFNVSLEPHSCEIFKLIKQ